MKQKLLQTRIPASVAKDRLATRMVELGVSSEAAYLRLVVLRDLGVASK